MAIQHLESLVQREPEIAEAQFLLAVALRRAERFDDLPAQWTKARQLGWSRKELKDQRYLAFCQVGRVKEVEPYLRKRLQQGATEDEAEQIYEALVRGYLKELRLREATVCVEYWIDWRPTDTQAWLLRGEIAFMAGNQNQEIEAYRTILSFEPGHYEASWKLGRALLVTNRVEEAYPLFARCHEENKQHLESAVGVAECLMRLGKPLEARQMLVSILEGGTEGTHQTYALSLLGQIALEGQDYEDAVRFLKQAVELNQADVMAQYNLGMALARIGKKDDAEKHLEISRKFHALDSQLADLAGTIMREPDNPDVRCQVGQIMLDRGMEEGFQWLLSALRCDPLHAKTHRALAAYYETKGQDALASRHREQAAAAGAGEDAELGKDDNT